MEQADFAAERRYSGNVEVQFVEADGWMVQAVVKTPMGERFYVENIRPEFRWSKGDLADGGEANWTPRLIDNVAKVLIDRAMTDDAEGEIDNVIPTNHVVAPTIKVERFAVFTVEEEYKHLGEALYVGRSRETRWPPMSACSPA